MKVSGSKRYLIQKCGWWARKEVTFPRQEVGPAAVLGSALHLVAEGHSEAEALAKYPMVNPEELLELATVWRSWWYDEEQKLHEKPWEKEAAFAFDPMTKKVRKISAPTIDGHRYEEALEHEMCGTIDLYMIKGDTAYIGDYKTGSYKTVDDCLAQLEFGAYCVTRFHNLKKAKVFINHVGTDKVSITSKEISFDELTRIGNQMVGELLTIESSEPTPGSHCRWCPALKVCPTTHEAMNVIPEYAIVRKPEEKHGLITEIDSPDTARRLYGFKARAEELVKFADKLLREYAEKNNGFEVATGTYYGPTQRTSKYIDAEKASAHLPKLMGPNFHKALDLKITKASIKRALEADGMGSTEAATRAAKVVDELSNLGAVKESSSTIFAERKRSA